MKNIVIFTSLGISILTTYLMYLFANNFVHIVDLTLDRIFDVRFGYWELQHIVFALCIGLIPIISVVPWSIRGHKKVYSLLIYNLLGAVLIALFVISAGIWLIVFNPNSGIFNTVEQPSIHFWNYVLPFSTILTFTMLVVFAIISKQRYTIKNEERLIDHSSIDQIK